MPGNHYAYCVRLDGQLFMQTGRMIAYYPAAARPGHPVRAADRGELGGFVATRFSAPLYTRDWVVATGAGHLLLGDRGYDINSYDLDDGNLTLRAANLLAFDSTLELKQSIVPGLPDPDRHRQVPGLQLRPGDLRRAADPGRPAGAGRLGRLPVARRTTTTPSWMTGSSARGAGHVRGQLRRGAAVRLHRRRHGAAAVHASTASPTRTCCGSWRARSARSASPGSPACRPSSRQLAQRRQ